MHASAYVLVISKMTPKLLQHGSKVAPKMFQNGSQISSKIDPPASWRALGAVLAAWRPLGTLLESSWRPLRPKTHCWDRLLDGPRAPWRSVLTILGAKCPPKRSPGGSQIEVRKRSEPKRAKSQNFEDVLQNSLIFQVPSLPLASKTESEMGSKTGSRR